MWLPGQTPRLYPRPLTTPKAKQWSPPKPSLPPPRLPTTLDEETISSVLAQAEEWAAEATRLEEKLTDHATRTRASQVAGHTAELPKIEFELGVIVQNMQRNSKKTLHEQLMEWDKAGDGNISKVDFKMRLREIGLHATMDDVEVLFARFDEDGSGFVDVEELTNGMSHLRTLMAAQAQAECENTLVRQKVQALQTRVADAKDAVASQEKAETCQRELTEMRLALEGRMDIKLGELLVKRCIKVETIIGTWPKARSRENIAHAREISKAEWKDEIVALGLVVGDGEGKLRPAERSELGALFDEVDADKSGWMDLKEAKDALRKWQQLSKDSSAGVLAKEKELARLRRRAATKLQGALRASEPAGSPGSDPRGSPGSPGSSFHGSPSSGVRLWSPYSSDGAASPDPPAHNSTVGYLGRMRKRKAIKEAEVRKADETRTEKLATKALLMVKQRGLAHGWICWHTGWKNHVQKLEKIQAVASILANAAADYAKDRHVARGWRVWLASHREVLHAVRLAKAADANASRFMLRHGWSGWVRMWQKACSQRKSENLVQVEIQPAGSSTVLPMVASPRQSMPLDHQEPLRPNGDLSELSRPHEPIKPPEPTAPTESTELTEPPEMPEPTALPKPLDDEYTVADGISNSYGNRMPDTLANLFAPFAAWLQQR